MPTAKQDYDFINYIIPKSILDEALDWMRANLSPEDVFSTSDLERWAESEGYIKAENQQNND